jgi:hypothetical protein
MATHHEALFEAPAAHAMAGAGQLRSSWKQDGTIASETDWEMAGGAQAGSSAAPVSYCHFPSHRRRWLRELAELLAFPSVLAQPEHRPDLEAAAVWLRDHLARIGLHGTQVLPGAAGGLPCVYGEWLDAPGRPTLLLYGHYDVQPTGPLHEWHSSPFTATVSGAQLIARGASDDKGQLFIHLKALESWLRTAGRLPLNVKVWLEVGACSVVHCPIYPERTDLDIGSLDYAVSR